MRKVILDTDEVYAAIDFSLGHPVFHCDLPNGITPTLYKYVKEVLIEDAMITLGSLGFDTVFSILPEENKKALKFNKAMGFEVELVEDGVVWLAQDVA